MVTTTTCRRPVRLNYFLRIPNVGDRINPAIVTAMSRRPTVYSPRAREPHLISAGSTMSNATPESHVWGTGVMHPDCGVGCAKASNVHAVRGKLSHSALRQAGVDLRDVPLGDPGYLAPSLLGIARSAAPTSSIGVVPHYVDRRNPNVRRLIAEPGVVELNVHDDPEHFLRAMAVCDAVISSSLHGLIFAEALGIPNLWVTAGDEIAGGPFKFHDWFSTTARPQQTAHDLTSHDTACQLSRRAALHDCTIDVAALQESFPTDRLDEMCESTSRPLVPVDECRSRPTPAFLISFNRGMMLERAIASIERLDRRTEIVVHDNGSSDAATLAILDKLEGNGARVVRRKGIASADDLNQVNDTIQEFFSNRAEPSRYVVSDCDIDMTIAAPETLAVYEELLNAHRQVESVGPMLKISDIPASYPLFNRVMNRHVEQFWHKQPEWSETSFGPVAHILTAIDTTFALHRAGEPFRRLKHSLRVYEPYEARHLDWYIDPAEGDVYAETSSAAISHWNNNAERKTHQDAQLQHDRYFVVVKNRAGALEVCEKQVRRTGPIQPFVAATDAQRSARIAHTEALRQARSTDVERWGSAASHYDSWKERGSLLAGFVRPGERVFEFGAGNSAVAGSLPAECRYLGSDAVPLEAGIMKCDLNAPVLPQLSGHDVALFSGVLEYVHDLGRLAAFLAQNFRSVVCSYAALVDASPDESARRRYSGWFNDLSEAEFSDLFCSVGFHRTKDGEWAGQVLFRWDA
jgi:hypothetical protein